MLSKDAVIMLCATTFFFLPVFWFLMAIATRMTTVNTNKCIQELKTNTVYLLVLYAIMMVCIVLSDKGLL